MEQEQKFRLKKKFVTNFNQRPNRKEILATHCAKNLMKNTQVKNIRNPYENPKISAANFRALVARPN